MKLEKGRNTPTKNSYYLVHQQPQPPEHQGQPLTSVTYHGKLANAIAGMMGLSKANRGRRRAQTQNESTANASSQTARNLLGASQRAYDT